MELLDQHAFEHQHKESAAGILDRGCFDKKTLEDSVDQNLDMVLVESLRYLHLRLPRGLSTNVITQIRITWISMRIGITRLWL